MSVTVSSELALAIATPLDMDVSTYPRADGVWVCRLEYVELPGCVAESRDPLEALECLERLRVEVLTSRAAVDELGVMPRAPLRT